MKKLCTAFILLSMLLSLCACGSKSAKPAAALPTASPTETAAATEPAPTETAAEPAAPEAPDADFYCGTWDPSGIIINDVFFSLEQAAAADAATGEKLSAIRFVICSDGTVYLSDSGKVTSSVWTAADNGVHMGSVFVPLKDDRLVVNADSFSICFEKVSDDQTPPQPAEPAATEAPTEPETTAPASGIRPEFKEAMDSYESFYNEYCDLLTKYMQNPTDFSLLAKYSQMITKAEEMNKKFDAWKDSDMTNEELQYYLEVTARIQQKLAGLL